MIREVCDNAFHHNALLNFIFGFAKPGLILLSDQSERVNTLKSSNPHKEKKCFSFLHPFLSAAQPFLWVERLAALCHPGWSTGTKARRWCWWLRELQQCPRQGTGRAAGQQPGGGCHALSPSGSGRDSAGWFGMAEPCLSRSVTQPWHLGPAEQLRARAALWPSERLHATLKPFLGCSPAPGACRAALCPGWLPSSLLNASSLLWSHCFPLLPLRPAGSGAWQGPAHPLSTCVGGPGVLASVTQTLMFPLGYPSQRILGKNYLWRKIFPPLSSSSKREFMVGVERPCVPGLLFCSGVWCAQGKASRLCQTRWRLPCI